MANSSALAEWLTWSFSPSLSAILVTLLVSLTLPVIIHFYLYRPGAAKELPTFLLLGPSGGGKTSLLTLFTTGTATPTHTSQASQATTCSLPSSVRTSADRYRSVNDSLHSEGNGARILLLDTPGHGKLRHHALSALTSTSTTPSRGLLFVVDSAAVSASQGLSEAAEFLHDVLLVLQKRYTKGKSSKTGSETSVLILANKQDVFTSLPAELVGKRLEAEIARVRERRSKGIMDSGAGAGTEEDEEGNWLGEFGAKEFGFEQLKEFGIEATVIGGSVRGDEGASGDVQGWWTWIGDQL